MNPRQVYIQTSKKLCLGIFNCWVLLLEVKELDISAVLPNVSSLWEGEATLGITHSQPLEVAEWFACLSQIVEYFYCSRIYSFIL